MIAGIDLGTTHSLIGVFDSGFPTLVADGEGNRLFPSVVSFLPNGEPLVGWPALRRRAIAPGETISSVKRLIGRRRGEVPEGEGQTLTGLPGGEVRIRIGGRDWSPEEVSALILSGLKRSAESTLGENVDRAVITVPAYFNDSQRATTRRAGEAAGFKVERILSEPTAAALAFGLDRLGNKAKIAVYDLGGGTFDLSILEMQDGVFEVLSTHGDTRLGGDDIDAALARLLCERMALPPERAGSLRDLAEDAKKRLSVEASVDVTLPFEQDGANRACTVTRRELEEIARPLILRSRESCIRALADARLAAGDLAEVVIVGGATRMPLVRQLVSEWFDREVNTSQHPDEAVALGATIEAGVLSGAVRGVTLLDVTPLSLGVETFGGLMNILIPRNSTIPCKAGEMFTNAVSGQTAMRVKILQGERELARDNWTLGEIDVPLPSAPKGQARVGVQFEIDADGILRVLARDVVTGTDHVLEVRGSVDVADTAVERMITSSVENAFEDMDNRLFTEWKLKADEILPAVAVGLQAVGSALDPAEREAIERLVTEVREALALRSTNGLKRSVEGLDEATERLATLLLEQAMGSQ